MTLKIILWIDQDESSLRKQKKRIIDLVEAEPGGSWAALHNGEFESEDQWNGGCSSSPSCFYSPNSSLDESGSKLNPFLYKFWIEAPERWQRNIKCMEMSFWKFPLRMLIRAKKKLLGLIYASAKIFSKPMFQSFDSNFYDHDLFISEEFWRDFYQFS